MSCSWLYLASRTTPEHFCSKPGHPYCEEHQQEIDYLQRLDDDWQEIEATHRAVCEEQEEEAPLCAVCRRRPVHDDCVYCENCCADDPLGILGPQG